MAIKIWQCNPLVLQGLHEDNEDATTKNVLYAYITAIEICEILINTLRPRTPAFRRPSSILLLKALSGTNPPQKPDFTEHNQTSTGEDENKLAPKVCRSKNFCHYLSY